MAGTAKAAPVAGPPAAGDCVIDPIVPGIGLLGAQQKTALDHTYAEYRTSPCRGSRYGEITKVIASPSTPVATADDSGDIEVTDTNLDQCWTAAYRYMGIEMPETEQDVQDGSWYPLLTVAVTATAPTIRQHAAGQHWLACIAYLPTDRYLGTITAHEQYTASIGNALFTGKERDRTGRCLAGPDLANDEEVPGCQINHQTEVFGVGTTGHHHMTRADLQRSCEQFVARLTGVVDLATTGLIADILATDNHGATDAATSIPADSSLTCAITTKNHRQLNGSLLARGTQPIPWA